MISINKIVNIKYTVVYNFDKMGKVNEYNYASS